MLIPHGTVIAVIDGKNLELFRNNGNEAEPDLAVVPSPALDSRNHSGAGHHSVPGNHADSLVAEDAHAGAVAAWINQQVLEHKLDNLVIIAAPRTLGELRRHYHKQIERVLLRELSKDLVGRQPSEILAALREKN